MTLADKEKATTEKLLASIVYLRSAEEKSIEAEEQEAREIEIVERKIRERLDEAEQAQRALK